MLYQRKRKKNNANDNTISSHPEYFKGIDSASSGQKVSSLSKPSNKSLTKILNKHTFNTDVSQNQHNKQPQYISFHEDNEDFVNKHSNYTSKDMILQKPFNLQKDKHQQSGHNLAYESHISPKQDNGLKTNRRKFKLYCQVKKKRQNNKNSENDKEQEKNYASSTASQSWLKHSVSSRIFEQTDSASTNISKRNIPAQKNKIDLTDKIRQIKSKEKQKQINKQDFKNSSMRFDLNLNENLSLKDKQDITKRSEKSSKRSKNSVQKKQSTVNIKRSVILEKLASQKSSRIIQSLMQNGNTNKEKERPLNTQKMQNRKQKFKNVQNKILPEESQIISESVKKLSQIKEQKNQDTVSRSLKANQMTHFDHSKSNEQTMNLSINSICKDRRQSYNCILQTTEVRQSLLRRSIESSLSELEKTRQKINIQKFKEPKTIGQMGSQLSDVQRNMSTIQKIQFHIELINTLSNFVYKSTELQYLMEDWDELNFLIYKKFFLERNKVLNFLKKYPIKNPFSIKRATIQTKQILKALRQNQSEITKIKDSLQLQNATIKKNLSVFYDQFSKQQYGQKINVFEYDNFSHWIMKQLWDQIQLFFYSKSHNQAELDDRICKSLQVGFLISQLNGNYVTPFEDAQIASHHNKQKVYIDDNMKIFERYVLNKKK